MVCLKRKNAYNVAVVGATGAVGGKTVETLEKRNFPVANIKYLAGQKSAGTKKDFKGVACDVELLTENSFKGIDVAFFCAGGSVSDKFVKYATEAGAVVIDKTSRFRMEPDVPLIVPEVNPAALSGYKKTGIISNPNCSTIQMVVALKPLHDAYGIKRVVVDTYQSVSGAGRGGIYELTEFTKNRLADGSRQPSSVIAKNVAFNCIPQIGAFLPNGYTDEEMKMVDETKKILEDNSMAITATTVRVPVFFGHSECVHVETRKPFEIDEARKLLAQMPGVAVMDDPAKKVYPTPALDAEGRDEVFVGRIRRDFSIENGLSFWCVSDNLIKGAALNAVQIAELLIKNYAE